LLNTLPDKAQQSEEKEQLPDPDRGWPEIHQQLAVFQYLIPYVPPL
jgi:hypothetical protein